MAEPLLEGLAPVVRDGARVLILGSFPSAKSLVASEYYANRGNRFWRLVGEVFGFDADVPYERRLDELGRHGVALWDVVHSCRRVGSMDTAIDRNSVVINDFGPLLAAHSTIEAVFANGSTAFEMFERHVTTTLPTVKLPSSSGALPMTFADRMTRWQKIA